MPKDEAMDFLDCHSCGFEMDVSKQVILLNRNPNKQIVKKNCEKCGSMSQLVISMCYGLTSVEKINKFKKHENKRASI
jgi:uncharacterized Zn finger protein